ncbi:Glucose/arabinose dehydrogenase, beta-propeller fold, partial [Prauserella marina]
GFVLTEQPSGQEPWNLTDFAYLPDGNGLLSTGKEGRVAWVSPEGAVRTIATLPVVAEQDLGLVGIGVAADYATSRQIYLARSVPSGDGYVIRLARWTVTGGYQPTGLTGERILLDLAGDSNVHGITGIVPAEDGTVWVSVGDIAGYTEVDPLALRAQNRDLPHGKILHITADGLGVPGNPYYDVARPGATASKVFASGFRSPFRFSIDERTGLPVVGDVGWNTWEEVNVVRPGANYGWPCWEGKDKTPGYSRLAGCANVGNTDPIAVFRHGSGIDGGNSVTGGIHYTGTSYPAAYRGAYFFGDYTRMKLWTLRYDEQGEVTTPPQSPPMGTGIGRPVKFAAAANGDIVYADIEAGVLRRLSFVEGNTSPVAKVLTSTDPATRTVTFDGSGSFDFDGDALTYDWDFGDGGTATGQRVSHWYAEGTERFTASLTVTDSLGAEGTTEVTVVPGNHSPVITPNVSEQRFAVGEPVTVAATANDVEDGRLDIEWTSAVVHCPEEATCHSHPGPSHSGDGFTYPFTDHPDSRMEFTATATDSEGVSASYTYVAWPREHRVTLTSNVAASLSIPNETGGSSAMVTEGAVVNIEAAPVATDGVSTFANWSNGDTDPATTIVMGGSDLTLTANYTTPVAQRYAADTALRTTLGAPQGPEVIQGGLYYQGYANGGLYWTAATGTHEVHGSIYRQYLALGGHARFGPPTTDETKTPDGVGRFNHFAGTPGTLVASVYWTPSTGAHGIWGSIRAKWAALQWERGPLGYPTTDESTTPDGVGKYNHFSKAGSVYWTPGTGAHEVYGAIRVRWKALGWERSYLRYPTSGEFAVAGGRRNNFQGGYIVWTAATDKAVDRRY